MQYVRDYQLIKGCSIPHKNKHNNKYTKALPHISTIYRYYFTGNQITFYLKHSPPVDKTQLVHSY